ncbi:MAG TPA: cytochrome c oxidase assembly protein [Ktedonobacteraceae bacterium]|jgi:cytochrome c oxidase assembly factor CtaG
MQHQNAGISMSHSYRRTFITGIVIALIGFVLPMDILGMNHMFTVHMAQHLLLALAASPLLLLSIPPSRLDQFLSTHRGIERVIRGLTIPFVASLLFNANLWFWHAPPLLAAMMENTGLHLCADALYLITGLLFWWPLLRPLRDRTLSLGGKLGYLFFSDMPMMLLGAGMTFSGPLYAFSMTNPPMHMVVTAEDQQLGGLLMWVVGGLFFYVVVASIFFFQWMFQQERIQQAEEVKFNEVEQDINTSY